MKVLVRGVRQEYEVKGDPHWKGRNKTIFSDEMILYVVNHRRPIKKLN